MDARTVVAAFDKAWADHDLDACLSMLTDDCVFGATGPAPDGTEHIGGDAIRIAWEGIFADPASQFVVEETIAAGDRVVQRWRYSWADGHVRGIDLFTVRHDRISAKLSYVKG